MDNAAKIQQLKDIAQKAVDAARGSDDEAVKERAMTIAKNAIAKAKATAKPT